MKRGTVFEIAKMKNQGEVFDIMYKIKDAGKKVKLILVDGQELYGYPKYHTEEDDGVGFNFVIATESKNVLWIRGLPSFDCAVSYIESFEVLD